MTMVIMRMMTAIITRHRTSTSMYSLNPVYTIQPVVIPIVQAV